MTSEACLNNTGREEVEKELSNSIVNSRGVVRDGRLRCGSDDSLLPGLIDDVALNCLARVPRSDYPSLACINKKYNRLIQSGYLYGLRRESGIMEYWVLMVCDSQGWMVFAPSTQKWMNLPRVPCDECFNSADKESLGVASELLVFGRECFELAIWKYSVLNRRWTKGEGIHYPRCLFASSSLGSVAIVAGGIDKDRNILKSAELYDSSSGRWEMLPNMHSPRRSCSGIFMDGKFYVVGGMSGPIDSLTCGEEFNLETRKWRKIEGMYPFINRATQAPPLVAVVDDELYTLEHNTNMVKKYNKEDNTWCTMGELPVRTDSSNGWGLAFKACEDKLLVVRGQRGPEGEAIVLFSWSPKSVTKDGKLDWQVIGKKENHGVFVYNCAVMGS